MGKGLFREARREKAKRQSLHLSNQALDDDLRKDIEKVLDRRKHGKQRTQ